MRTSLGQGVLLAALLGLSPGASQEPELGSCPSPSFLCEDGTTCLEPEQQCDGVSDCPRHEEGFGGEDEEDCQIGSGQEDELAGCDPDAPEKPDKPSVRAEELSDSRVQWTAVWSVKCAVYSGVECQVCSVQRCGV